MAESCFAVTEGPLWQKKIIGRARSMELVKLEGNTTAWYQKACLDSQKGNFSFLPAVLLRARGTGIIMFLV